MTPRRSGSAARRTKLHSITAWRSDQIAPRSNSRNSPGFQPTARIASNKRTYSYGAHAAYVAVDPRTGQVELIDYVAIEDVGRIVNPLTLHGQCVGAVVQGLGGALLEHFIYDENGQFLTGSFADYLMPTASDFPSIRAVALEREAVAAQSDGHQGRRRGRHHPGRRCRRQRGRCGAELAGVKPHELPLTPPRVWQMIQTARQLNVGERR